MLSVSELERRRDSIEAAPSLPAKKEVSFEPEVKVMTWRLRSRVLSPAELMRQLAKESASLEVNEVEQID